MSFMIECVVECGNHLGEGPVWDAEERRLYWVDGTGRRFGNTGELGKGRCHVNGLYLSRALERRVSPKSESPLCAKLECPL